ncbi:MAG: DUF4401 domain-containing protein, partial [Verrucomicrobiota bacterium]
LGVALGAVGVVLRSTGVFASPRWRPIGWGVIASLGLILLVQSFMDHDESIRWCFLAIGVLVTGSFLVSAGVLVRPATFLDWLGLVGFGVVLLVFALFEGVLIAAAIGFLIMGVLRLERPLVLCAALGLGGALLRYYYETGLPLMTKSLVLLGTAGLLLAAAVLAVRFTRPNAVSS